MTMSTPKALIVGSPAGRPGLLIGATSRELLCVGNAPIVFHVLAAVRRAGVAEAVLAVDGAVGDAIRSAVGSGRRWNMRISYVECDAPGDAVSAILAAEELLSGAPFLVHPGDGILGAPLAPFVQDFLLRGLNGLSIVPVERRARRRGRMAPAPHEGGNDERSASTVPVHAQPISLCILSEAAFDCLHGSSAKFGDRLADVLERLNGRGGRVEDRESDHWWGYDGGAESLLSGNRLVLDELEASDIPDGVVASEISGRVAIHPTAVVRSSVVRGPAAIGAGAELRDAFIGPYTSVGDRVVVEGAEIADSILLPGGVIRFLSERIERSVLGRDARLCRDFALPRAVRLVAGDGTEIAMT